MPLYSPRKASYRQDLLDPSQLTSLEAVNGIAYEIQSLIRKDNLPFVLEDVLKEDYTLAVPLVLSCLDEQQCSWLLDTFPTTYDSGYPDSLSQRLLLNISHFLLSPLASNPIVEHRVWSSPSAQYRAIRDVPEALKMLSQAEFMDELQDRSNGHDVKISQREMKKRRRANTMSRMLDPQLFDRLKCLDESQDEPSDHNVKVSQREMKKRRRAKTMSRTLDPQLFDRLDVLNPETKSQANEVEKLLLTRQKSLLQFYLDLLRDDGFVKAIREHCVAATSPEDQDDTEVVPQGPSTATQLDLEDCNVLVPSEPSVYPKIHPMKAALYFNKPEDFGEWPIHIRESAQRELRFRCKKERKTFDIIVKKIVELSHGHFSPDSNKRLCGSTADVYEAKLTSDLRLVYQVDLVPYYDERVCQGIKIFGIYTHAQMENNRIWDSVQVGKQLERRSKEYKERCSVRIRTPNADPNTFTPAFFPPLPELEEQNANPSNMLDADADTIHSRFLMEKYVELSQPLMNTMLADIDATFPHLVSPYEKQIIEHPHSCYVIGRSGTGKTTTLLFKMLLVERTYQLAEPGTPKPRQIFVTQSRILAYKVQQYFRTMSETLNRAPMTADELRDLQASSSGMGVVDDAMINLNFVQDWYKNLPARFSQLEDSHFPLFVTFDALCTMIEADMAAGGTAVTSGPTDAHFIEFRQFLKRYWPALPQSLTKKTDPSLAFGQIIGVIKGSESTIYKRPHVLDLASYRRVSGQRHAASTVTDYETFYSLFEAYASKKKAEGARDIADRTHTILDHVNKFGLPGQKVDHLYVDEVQDNLLIDTLVLRAICLNGNGLFWAGDTAQAISAGSSFHFNELKAFQWRLEEKRQNPQAAALNPSLFQLAVNYRSHSGIVNCAHSIIHLINHFWPNSIDYLAPESSTIDGPKPIFFSGEGGDNFVLDNYLFGDSSNPIEFGAQQCILVRDKEALDRLKEKVGEDIGVVLTIYDSKGLEFNDVLLYDFFEDSSVEFARWRVLLNAIKEGKVPNVSTPLFDNSKHANIWLELKFLYVAITRARENVWIADSSTRGEPLKMFWNSRNLIREVSMKPGMDGPRLATSSTPEEWMIRGNYLFHQQKYEQAKHCYIRADQPNHVLKVDAHISYEKAEGNFGKERQGELRTAGKLFRQCSDVFKPARRDYLALSGRCFEKAGDKVVAATTYIEAEMFKEAVIIYRDLGMFDEAVQIVLARQLEDTTLVEDVLRRAKFFYFREVQTLPESDPQRSVRMDQGISLFETPEDILDYLEARDLDIAQSDILAANGRFNEAAELHLAEGRIIEATKSFLKSGDEASTDRAAQCILEGLWRAVSFAVRRSALELDSAVSELLGLASVVQSSSLNKSLDRELSLFVAVLSPTRNETSILTKSSLRDWALLFLSEENIAAALLCFDHYFDGFPSLQDRDITLKDLVGELQIFSVYIERLLAAVTNSPTESSQIARLFGFRKPSEGQIILSQGSFLSKHFQLRHGLSALSEAESEHEIQTSSGILTDLIFSSVMDHLRIMVEQENELCRNMKAFTLCNNFVIVGYCNRKGCPKAHVSSSEMTSGNYYSLAIRVHVQQILLFRRFRLYRDVRYFHQQRRYWMTSLYDALFPPYQPIGNVESLDLSAIPEIKPESLDNIQAWLQSFLYSHRLLPEETFISLLLRGGLLVLNVVPVLSRSITRTTTMTSLTARSTSTRALYSGEWSMVRLPPHFFRVGGSNIIYDLIATLEAATPSSLIRGIFALRHIILERLYIDISVLCDVLDSLCKNLILSRFCWFDGPEPHGLTLPRSWLITPIDPDRCRQRSFAYLTMLVQPMRDLLAQIHTGQEADHLLYQDSNMRHGLPGPIRSMYITRICRALALLGYNFRIDPLKESVLSVITSLSRLEPPPPPAVPYYRYAYAESWGWVVHALRRTPRSEELVEILHSRRLSAEPLRDVPGVRRLVYRRLGEIPALLRSPVTGEPSPLIPQIIAEAQSSLEMSQQEQSDGIIEELREEERGEAADEERIIENSAVDEDSNIIAQNEEEHRILSVLSTVYRKKLNRRQAPRTGMGQRINEIFLACLKEANHTELLSSSKYRKMMLGPLPHILASLQWIHEKIYSLKNDTKEALKNCQLEELDIVEKRLTSVNSAIKEIISIQKALSPKSKIHQDADLTRLKQNINALKALIDEALPLNLTKEIRAEFELGWKGIVKEKEARVHEKRILPSLNTEDL